MIGKWVVLGLAALMSLSAPANRPALAAEGLRATNSVSAISGFFSRKLNMFTPPSDATQAGKQTSVILKRQVPIRFDEAPRSWLGGLPMMPQSVAWPRAANGAPLHFIAEINCADLPANLWNGLGPRKGWLLLFVDVLEFDDLSADGAVQVLHVDQLGPERQPPEDMPTVRHSMTDLVRFEVEVRPGIPRWHRIKYEAEVRPGVPKMWRRWPVDLVVQDYTPSDEDGGGPPPVSGEELYKAPVSGEGIVLSSFHLGRPLTWRGALYFVDELIRRDLDPAWFETNFIGNQGGLLKSPGPDQNRAGLMAQAWAGLEKNKASLEEARVVLQRRLDDGKGKLAPADREFLTNSLRGISSYSGELEQQRDYLTGVSESHPGPAGDAFIGAEIERLGKAHLAWAAQLRSSAERLKAHILMQDLDAPLSDEDWRPIEATFQGTSTVWLKSPYSGTLERAERSLYTDEQMRIALREDALDAYTRNNATNPAIPKDLLGEIEARLRFIYGDRPHRMGGQPGRIQPDSGPVPDGALLFQMGSDEAMGWSWGDAGALYVTVPQEDLRQGRFDRVRAWIEGY